MRTKLILCLCLIILFLSGCSSLPEADKLRAKSLDRELGTVKSNAEEQGVAYGKFVDSAEYEFFKPYAEKEQWRETSFNAALNEIARARGIFDKDVKRLISADDPKDSATLNEHFVQIQAAIDLAKKKMSAWQDRKTLLAYVRDNSEQIKNESATRYQQAKEGFTSLSKDAEQAKKDFPQRETDVTNLVAPFGKSLDVLTSSKLELDSHIKLFQEKRDPNFAVIADSYTSVKTEHKSLMEEGIGKLQPRLKELYGEYTKTLLDMKGEFEVEVDRSSWDENSDSNSEREVSYESVKVDLANWLYFNELPDESVLALYKSWYGTSLEPKIEPERWNALHIDPTANWPSTWDNHAEFTLGEVDSTVFHKYRIIQNGVAQETDWVEVEEDFFDDHLEDLGMDLMNKPKGLFESEADLKAVPPGLAYVDNPSYGTWKTDSSGQSFWVFYGQYRFMTDLISPNYNYNRSEWEYYNRDYRGKRGFYGKYNENEQQRYGTYGSYATSSPRSQGTYFATMGGFNSTTQSVRQAGLTSRGGGPGGGGK